MNVYMLLDRSGSMESMWKEAINSINAYVSELPAKTNVFLAVFDSMGYDVARNTTAKEWKDISAEEYSPRGSTPLYDSAARLLHRAFDDNPDKAAFIVMTDGEENMSRNFNQSAVKALIADAEKRKWQVIFLGANFDKVGDQAMAVGLQSNKFMNMTAGNMQGSLRTLGAYTTAYASGASADINWSDQDKFNAVK